jgi:NAD(P)H-hydrate epimerase
MIKIVKAEQMRELDRLTVERAGIPWEILMETAGSRVTETILSNPKRRLFAVFCGKGNNGGDGAVIARQLWMRGAASVDLFLFGRVEETKGEARTNFEIARKLAALEATSGGGELTFTEITSEAAAEIQIYHDCIVDALFGTGLTRPVEGLYAKAIETINRAKATLQQMVTIAAVDIPSGLPSDSAEPLGAHVQADLTVTFTAPKLGNVLPPASNANGELVVAAIGTPAELIAESDAKLYLVEQDDVREWLDATRRTPNAHKSSVGDVLVIAGARGKTGAAALTAEAVLRSGAGLVTVATARSAQDLLIAQARNEVMTEWLDETEQGSISDAALERALELARKRSVIALGPGLSSSEASTRQFVRDFVEKRTSPIVIDADGLNALSPWPAELRGSAERPIIITPHPGEMARLTGKTNADIVAARVEVAREFAMNNQVITILKGQRTIIADPNGDVYINPTGNAGMATAGSGDVLTGLTSGLLAQSVTKEINVIDGVIAAVYLHGLAGDLAAEQLGQRPLLAGSITEHLPEALQRVGGENER